MQLSWVTRFIFCIGGGECEVVGVERVMQLGWWADALLISQVFINHPLPPWVDAFSTQKKEIKRLKKSVSQFKLRKHLIPVQSYCVIHCAENFPLLLTFYIKSKKKWDMSFNISVGTHFFQFQKIFFLLLINFLRRTLLTGWIVGQRAQAAEKKRLRTLAAPKGSLCWSLVPRPDWLSRGKGCRLSTNQKQRKKPGSQPFTSVPAKEQAVAISARARLAHDSWILLFWSISDQLLGLIFLSDLCWFVLMCSPVKKNIYLLIVDR